jgi:hypothetical protein
VIAARVDDDGFFGDGVADDGAIALQRADGEGFADERWDWDSHEKSWTNGDERCFRILLHPPI